MVVRAMLRCGIFLCLMHVLPSVCLPSHCRADTSADSLALFGAWRWIRSAGGLLGANSTPPPSGWSRSLHFRRDGEYSYLENDSLGQYLLCSGHYNVHAFSSARSAEGGGATLWVELDGWWWSTEANQLITFLGRDTISTYPGSNTTGVSDALTHTFARERTQVGSSPAASPQSRDRPPRIISGLTNTYYVDLSSGLRNQLLSLGQFFEWMDWQYPASVRNLYRYAHDQIPSGVIGDFDGDGSVDVAIHGSTGYDESKVICLLSNRGERRAALLLSEPTAFEPSVTADPAVKRFREPHPTLFLTVLHSGEEARDLEGKAVSFPSDVIVVARPEGTATPYYYAGGEFRTGRPLASPRWNALDPR